MYVNLGMGNEYVPEEKSKPGMTSSLMNSVTSTIQSFRGDGTDAAYTGHPGATSSFNRPNDDHRSNGTYVGGGSGGAGSGPTQYSSSGMTGIGNPNYKDARDEKSWYQKAQEAAKAASIASFGNISNSMQKTTVALNQGSGEYTFANNRGLSVNSLESAYSPKQPMNAFGGPSWQPQNSSPSIGNSAGPGGVVPVFYEGSAGYGKAGSAASDGQYEKTMIDALCEPGGLKSVPPEDKLQSFMAVAPTLSAEVVGECLIEVLNSDAWQSRAKALIVISYLVKGKECDSHLEWWLDRTEELHSLTSDPKGTVRTQASKTLKALNADDGHSIVEQKTQSRKTVVPSATSTNVSLLDIDEVSTTAVELTVDTVETGSLFAGMSMGTVSSKSHSPAPSSPAPPSIPPQVLPSFDTLVPQEIVTSTPAVAPIASVSSPMSSSNAISDHFDFLDILNVPQETPIVSQNAVTSSLFGDLNVKSNVASGAPPPVPPMPPNNQQYTNDLSSLTLQPTMNQGSSVPIMAVKPMQYTAGSNNISNLSLDPKKQVSNHDPFQVLATGTGVGQQSAPVSIRPIPPTGVQQQVVSLVFYI